MTQTHLCEIDFYIDGELGPDEACEVEAQLERDTRARALFDTVWRQKESLARALEAMDVPSPVNRHTARLQAKLARALACRLSAGEAPDPQPPALKTT